MKRSIWKLIIILSFAAFVPTLSAQDIDLATLSADDVKAVRKIIADRDYYKAAFEESQRQVTAWKDSTNSWRTLYLSEKDRADRVQGGRIFELQKALDACQTLNAMDKQRIGELEFSNRKLKGQRKWYFGIGVGTGAALGAYGAKKLNF